MKEDQQENTELDSKSEKLSKDLKGTFGSFKSFLSDLLDIRSDTDRDSTIEAVKKDITFKGHNAWILIFSIFVASIGLNVSSTAVIIGAMLISPLMGPIVGIGLSVAINDVDTLRRSLINLGVMVGLSVFTAFLYFWVSPLTGSNAELEARTYPTILDVLVAIFGGLALIVAKTKKGTIASVIFGVAIATALMPPLCTVGYGLAQGNFSDAGGALYLFSINATFIALSTFVVSKLLGFPLVRYANSKRRRVTAQIASIIAIIVMVPSIYLFYNMLKESYFKQEATRFVEEELMIYEDSFLQKNSTIFAYNGGTDPKIEVSFLGKEIPSSVISLWRTKMKNYKNLEDASLIILQNENTESYDQLQYMREFKRRDSLSILNKDERISFLETELKKLSKLAEHQIPFNKVSKEAKINYDGLASFSYADKIISNFNTTDTIPEFRVVWADSIPQQDIQKNEMKLKEWLQFTLELDTLVFKRD
ncbi:DUF389 domain-containing protein [Mesonia sp.]|uniref:DUF389 domain-containing protein n=1 Tax=Mesonia sp. TaxID=1960830 RepID=UPI00177A1ED4|nr:DUF389 domain-containing protein [Mesonia sp.]HIB37830.1 DUF389 domain-containing protein [Mesonia sp.]HIO26729.1 DUF389 domain-containing protein [Flavobacteriaceae bacterium]